MTITVTGMAPTTTIPEKEEVKRPTNPRKKMVRMASVEKHMVCSTKYTMSKEEPLPELPDCAVRIRVCFAGACSPDVKKKRNSIRNRGLMDTSLFPGYEVSGVVDEVGPSADTDLVSGDKVMVYPDEDIGFDEGYTDYVIIKNPGNLVKVPQNMSMEVAALLPCGGLTAYTAIMRARPYIRDCEDRKGVCNILVVGAGGLGLWATIMASHLSSAVPGTCDNRVKVIVADTNSEKLTVAKQHGCYGVVHWPRNAYEEQVIERTKNACPAGIDVVIDFVSSPRTISRALNFLNKRGALVVSGTSQHEVQFNLANLAVNEQTIIGVRKGSKDELLQLSSLVASEMVSTPQFNTFQLEEAEAVFQGLSDCKINGRAVIQVSPASL